MASLTLKGREIPLLYTTYEMKQIQEEVCPLGDLQYVLFGRAKDAPEDDMSRFGSPEHLSALGKTVVIFGNAGLEEAGEAPDLTEKKVLRSLRTPDLVNVINACTQAMREGMESEFPDKEDEGPVDVTLEEMKKKDGAAG